MRQAYGRLVYRAAVSLRGEDSVYARLTLLRQLEFQPREVIARMQREALTRVLRESLPHIPYYAQWAHVASSVSVKNVMTAISQLPVVEKEVLQGQGERLMVEGWRGRSYTKTTGGSTGRPVTVRKNAEAIAQEMAATWLGYGWFGVHAGDPCVRFWGRPTGNVRRRIRYWAADAATNRITLSAFGYTTSSLDRYLRRILRFRPTFLYGYVSAMEHLARHLADRGESLGKLNLKAVITTSETLSNPQRMLLERIFCAPVQNEYGCGEVGPIAYECPEGTLHLIPTNHFVELLRDDGTPAAPGEPGSVVITDLNNAVMPLIRYRVGDTASLGHGCPCGRSFPVLEDVFGREYDAVKSRSGRRFHGEFFMYLFEDLRNKSLPIGQFKVVQLDWERLLVQLVLQGGGARAIESKVVQEFHRRLPEFQVKVELKDTIERAPSGKMRVVESRVSERP